MEKDRTYKKVEKEKGMEWENDSDVFYIPYYKEGEFISPKEVSKKSIEKIKNAKIFAKRGHVARLAFKRNSKDLLAA
ncbi:hypothetical protein IKE98_01565 [Candidatus Saccharibacteria bacterium]|nr:hypothetical protein [Candidatus Saccharibacteria bacterium]